MEETTRPDIPESEPEIIDLAAVAGRLAPKPPTPTR